MGGGGSSGKTTNVPWTEAQPYLKGDEARGIPGIFPESAKLYGEGGITGDQQKAVDLYKNFVMGQAMNPSMNYANWGANALMTGEADTKLGPVGPAQYNGSQYDASKYQNIKAQQSNLQGARRDQGALDPSGSLSKLLSGRPDNPYLDQQANAITANLTRNMQENVMPGIRSEALASGQYGGSRQGIAEGLAASRLNQDLAPALTSLYGGAYENAQQRMFGTAGALNDQAFQNSVFNTNQRANTNQFNASNALQNNQFNATNTLQNNQFNAGNALQNNQFNANLGLQNNNMLMQQNQNNINNRIRGLDVLNQANNMQNQHFTDYMEAAGMPQNLNWQNLMNYSGIMQPGSNLGSTQTQTAGKNRLASAAGGALSGAAMGAMYGSAVPGIGTAIGALGGAVVGGLGGGLM